MSYEVSEKLLKDIKEESEREKLDAFEAGYTEAMKTVYEAILDNNGEK